MTVALGPASSVCALIPHHECEGWLAGAIESLLEQTRPLDAIVVMDDASARPPVEVVRRYPGVTLLAAPDNGGPYRLVQAVVEATDFDAYLFQDADDWSAPDRLEVLLSTAAESGGELVGSHEVRVLVEDQDMLPFRYPLDVNAAFAVKPAAFPLLHPTSMVSRDLVVRLGGFATGMRFSGDAEFLRRATHVARIVNADHFGYFRRKRAGSLTTAAETGFASPARQAVQAVLAERAGLNAEAAARGAAPDLSPWQRTALPALKHLAGPDPVKGALAVRPSAGSGARARQLQDAQHRPVFVIGPPRAGERLLAWSLAQGPSLNVLPDATWLARSAAEAVLTAHDDEGRPPAGYLEHVADALVRTAVAVAPHRFIAGGSEVTDNAWALSQLFPQSCFVFLSRSVEDSVAAVLAAPTDGRSFYTEETARRQWAAATRTCLDLEVALGPERVLRIDHAELLASPETMLQRCAELLGAALGSASLRPFQDLVVDRPSPAVASGTAHSALARQVAALSARLSTGDAAASREEAAARLSDALRRRSAPSVTLADKVRSAVLRTVPEGAIVVVVSRGDDALLSLSGSVGWHFPQAADGVYAGHHPASSEDAVAHLEQLRERGAEYFVVPASSLWWLSYYSGLRQHLDDRYCLVSYEDDAGAIYRLNAGATDQPAVALRWVARETKELDP